jgi:2-hydroxychromene-2-carboxylate isomerase
MQGTTRGSNDQMTSQNALANAKLLFKALAAREANLDEPIPNIRITDVAVQIGLEGDEFDSALDYAADHGWFEDAEVGDSANWVSLTPAGVAAAKS